MPTEHRPAPANAARVHAPEHYGFIDALRGLAFLAVFFFHVGFGVAGLPGLLSDVLGRGYFGVQLFFVVSAFTLCASLESRGDDRRSLVEFFIRRVCRIAPMFWCAIVIYWVVGGIGSFWSIPGVIGLKQYVLAFLLAHGFDVFALNGVVPGGWSVAVEAQFYLVLPLLFRFASSLWRAIALLVAAVVLSVAALPLLPRLLALVYPAMGIDFLKQFAFYSLPVQLPIFCFGILTYRLLGPDRAALAKVERFLRMPIALRIGLVLAIVLVLAYPLQIWASPIRTVPRFPGLVGHGIAFSLLLYACASCPLWVIDNRVTRYLGKISYSAYLVQFVMLSVASRESGILFWVGPIGKLVFDVVLGFGMTIGLATVTYASIEQPGIAFGRRLIARRREKAAASAAAAKAA